MLLVYGQTHLQHEKPGMHPGTHNPRTAQNKEISFCRSILPAKSEKLDKPSIEESSDRLPTMWSCITN